MYSDWPERAGPPTDKDIVRLVSLFRGAATRIDPDNLGDSTARLFETAAVAILKLAAEIKR